MLRKINSPSLRISPAAKLVMNPVGAEKGCKLMKCNGLSVTKSHNFVSYEEKSLERISTIYISRKTGRLVRLVTLQMKFSRLGVFSLYIVLLGLLPVQLVL